jgi:hypothetical protein
VVMSATGDFSLESSGAAFYLIDPALWKTTCNFIGNEISGHYLLGTAMAAVGLSTSRSDVSGVGYRPFLLGFAGAMTVGGVGFAAAMALPYASELIGAPLVLPVSQPLSFPRDALCLNCHRHFAFGHTLLIAMVCRSLLIGSRPRNL